LDAFAVSAVAYLDADGGNGSDVVPGAATVPFNTPGPATLGITNNNDGTFTVIDAGVYLISSSVNCLDGDIAGGAPGILQVAVTGVADPRSSKATLPDGIGSGFVQAVLVLTAGQSISIINVGGNFSMLDDANIDASISILKLD
jgi:hypothetical protein